MLKVHLKYVQVDACTRTPFRGVQVAVFTTPTRLAPEQMQNAAQELSLPECAFLYKTGDARYEIRAYSPDAELDAAGTAALAAAHALFTEGQAGRTEPLAFDAPRESFMAERRADHTTLIVSSRHPEPFAGAPDELARVADGGRLLFNGFDLLLPLAHERDARAFALAPDLAARATGWPGERLVVTAPSAGADRDFVVRTFALRSGVAETPACAATYRALGPYWLERLSAPIVRGEQLHRRGGVVHVESAAPGTLAVSAQAVTTVKGIFTLVP